MLRHVPPRMRNLLLAVLIVVSLLLPELRPVAELILGFAVALLIPLVIGFVISLPALIPPIRRLGRRSQASRIGEVAILGVLAFLVCFVALNRIEAEASRIFINLNPDTQTFVKIDESLWPATVRELWLRGMIPPSLRQRCYTQNESVCSQVDLIGDNLFGRQNPWSGYLLIAGPSLVPTLFCMVFVWQHTRQPSASDAPEDR